MSDLVEFLKARLDERAENAKHIHVGEECSAHWEASWGYVYDPKECNCGEPTRVRADVAVKRSLLGFWSHAYSRPTDFAGPDWDRVRGNAWWTLKKLALPFADHSDYREEFKP